jgi:hypothetical protein
MQAGLLPYYFLQQRACISHSRWLIVGEMARCAVSESCAVVDTKGEYRRAHRDSVERVIIFDASARISG